MSLNSRVVILARAMVVVAMRGGLTLSLSLSVLCIGGTTIATHIVPAHVVSMRRYIIGPKNSNNLTM